MGSPIWSFAQFTSFTITFLSHSKFIMSMPRMSALLSTRKCKTMDTQNDSFQAITNDVTSFMEKTEQKFRELAIEERAATIMKYNFKGALEIKSTCGLFAEEL